MDDLNDRYILMIKLEEPTYSKIIMIRFIVFKEFEQGIYPKVIHFQSHNLQAYLTILMNIIHDQAFDNIYLQNKIADIKYKKLIPDSDSKQLEIIYKRLCVD